MATTNKRINLQETKLRLTHYKFIACNSISLYENSPEYLRLYVVAFIWDDNAILFISILNRTNFQYLNKVHHYQCYIKRINKGINKLL